MLTRVSLLTKYLRKSLTPRIIFRGGFFFAVLLTLVQAGSYLFVREEFSLIAVNDILAAVSATAATLGMAYGAWWSYRFDRKLGNVWRLFMLGMAAWALGDIIWAYYELVIGEVPYPSIADIVYLSSYILFFVGILKFPRQRKNERDGTGWLWLDMFIIMFSAGGVFWNFLIGPALLDNQQSRLAILVNSAYPLGDLLLVLSITLMIFLPRSSLWLRPMYLMLAGHALSATADSIYVYQTINDAYASSAFINILFSIGPFILMLSGLSQAVAIQQVTLGQKTTPLPSRGKLIIFRLVSPFAWLLFAFLLLDFGSASKQVLTSTQFSIWLGAIIILLAVRQVVSTLDNRRLARKLQTANDQLEKRVAERTSDLSLINADLLQEMEERKRVEIMLREREEKLTHFGLHDALTGLPNRSLLLDRLTHATQRYHRHPDDAYAILFLDFDGFKVINDSLGHPAGDQLLVQIGQRLTSLMRAEDTVARLGGDEFVLLIQGFDNPGCISKVADRILDSMKEPFLIGKKPIYISASIGVVIASPTYGIATEIIRDADLAMYKAKIQGKAQYVIFQPSLRLNAINRQTLDSDLRRALQDNEFLLYYQPIVSLKTGHILGFEALIRWQHPTRGFMNPSEFIQIAESSGFIDSITRWTLQEACLQLSRWQSRFPQALPLTISINLSAISLRQPELLRWVGESLQAASLSPDSLILEIVENIFIQDPELAGRTFKNLRELGVGVSLDDFGTGYSSLGYINQYPIDTLKIDRSFISRVTQAKEVDAIVRAIITLARDLNFKVVAEGIETQEQLDFMKQIGCQNGQGYFFYKPMEKKAIDTLLSEKHELEPDSLAISRL